YDEVLKALRILNDPDGIGIGARHLTVSTSGVIPGIRKFADIPEQFTLAVSLHSAIQSTRNKLMPGVKKYTLLRLHEALQLYTEKTGRRPTYEYAMIEGVNDTNP
ncbi:23S rRNA (adenine(2503)-C(2))-methyltransferase RlmN, partial [Pseudodesulfovibrio sp. JC047]|nr:23S rRNA (adenine(2503)-C(2))-methyltransferase RlmN [Pseudodesulfovibrio sp. JC047]